jgi:radical SAM protein with 4Fe4S-binding SPASM domain
MNQITEWNGDTYLAVRGDFVLKVDGGRPVLYPLDYSDTRLLVLKPIEGFALSLLNGQRRVRDVESMYETLFPDAAPGSLAATLESVDNFVKSERTQSGIGQYGVLERSATPIHGAPRFDPREFVIGPDEYAALVSDYKTKRRLRTPISILCVFTSRCATNCAYCYAERTKTTEMSLARWVELIREMRQLGIRLCSPDNGDVFARKDGIEFCEALLENGLHFLLSTKSYVSAEHVRRLVDGGLALPSGGMPRRTVQLSIDAVSEDVQRRLYGVPPICRRTAETFDNFMRYGLAPRIKAVITGYNVNEAKALVDYFYPRGARQFHFARYSRTFFRHVDELFLNQEQVEAFRRQYQAIQEQYPDTDCWQDILPSSERPAAETLDRRTIWDRRKGCGGGWLSLGIGADGRAFLCEQMKMSEEFVVGDLSVQSIQEVWNSPRLLDFIYPERERFEGTICRQCPEFEKCMWESGRCYRDAYFCYGTIYDSPPLCPYNSRPGVRLS